METSSLVPKFNLHPTSHDNHLTIKPDRTPSREQSGEMVVFHKDPLGIVSFVAVYVLLLFGDYGVVYHVIEYGQHER